MSTVSKKHRYNIIIPLFHVNQIPQIFVGGVERLKCARALDFIEERDQDCSTWTSLAENEHAYPRPENACEALVHIQFTLAEVQPKFMFGQR